MNFQSLKGMIDSIIKGYLCPECNSSITESNIDIIGAAGTTINIDIECSMCKKHSMIKTEVLSIDLTKKGISPENIDKIKKGLLNGNVSGKIVTNQKTINDNEIVSLNNDLRENNLDVSGLLGSK